MDMQKSAASRVRHILQAMERSIDSARTRRVHDHGGTPGDGPSQASASATPADSWPSAHITPAPNRTAATPPVPAANPRTAPPRDTGALIGGNHPTTARQSAQPADPNQPARLKAKPKRFEGTFAAQFPSHSQPTYRSQAG